MSLTRWDILIGEETKEKEKKKIKQLGKKEKIGQSKMSTIQRFST